MAEGDAFIYNSFNKKLLEGVYNLANGGDTLKVTLHTGYTPNIDSHDEWADVSATEYGTADGYTAGGETLANQAVTQDNTNDLGKFDGDDVTWTSLGPLTPDTPSHAILWDDTVSGDPLIAYWELGESPTNGGDYRLQWSSNGIIRIT